MPRSFQPAAFSRDTPFKSELALPSSIPPAWHPASPGDLEYEGAQVMLDTDARCRVHGEAPAVEVCRRCGAFLCAECRGNEVLCGHCLAHHGRKPVASAQAWVSLYLGLAGLACGFLPGVVGLVLAQRELERIARGESSPAGRALANAGRLLGWLNAALLAVVGVLLLSRLEE